MNYDSDYEIRLATLEAMGGDVTKEYDSVYDIDLEILRLIEEGGGSGKPIEEVSELPNAEENKDKFYRLDNGEKDIYAAKLLSSETITTNRLPDEQQIDKAYLVESEADFYYYKGAYKIVCSDGELEGYGWLGHGMGDDVWWFYLTEDNAVNININSLGCYISSDDGVLSENDKTITTEMSVDDFNFESLNIEYSTIAIPAIYNAPESAQIGNAYLRDDITYFHYTGVESTVEYDGEQVTGYKWEWQSGRDYLLTTKKSSEFYYTGDYNDGGFMTDVKILSVNGNNVTDYFENIEVIYIPQLNAPDSEQVDNAYVKEDYTEVTEAQYYKGAISIHCTDGDLILYYWEGNISHHIQFTLLPANNIFSNQIGIISEDYLGDELGIDWSDMSVDMSVSSAQDVVDSLELIEWQVSTVKYQRTETTEEWGWEKIATEQYVDDAIDNIDIPEYVAGEGIAIEDNKISAKGYKYIDNIQAFIENPYSYQRNFSEYPLSMLGITELKLTGSANALTYTYSGSGSTVFEQMAGMIITNMGGGLKIESGNYAYLESIDTTNKTVTFKSTLDADNALSNAVVTAIVVKTDFFISGGSGDTTYSYTDTTDIASSIEYFIDSNLYMKFEGYPLVKVTAIDTENETITFNKTLNAESAISNVNFEYGRYDANDASGINSHVEGADNECSGNFAHAEGWQTTASGISSHAEGEGTTAQNESEHAEGWNNVSHKVSDTLGNAGNTQHSIGIRGKNAFEVMQNGDMYVYGVGGYQGTDTKVQDATIKTLQEYIASLEARIAALEGN